ncbi:MAG: hypothetical protein GY861_28920 [bacterium]|nr:hypothetical protein [bacterium]
MASAMREVRDKRNSLYDAAESAGRGAVDDVVEIMLEMDKIAALHWKNEKAAMRNLEEDTLFDLLG